MKIKNEILFSVVLTVIALSGISSTVIYFLFDEYREEEFQQRQKNKINLTIRLLEEYKEMTENLTAIMDKLTLHDFYDEKMLIFDRHKNLIYKSIDDLEISSANELLNRLSPAQQWIETKENKYDIIAVYVESEDNHFYAISKAYDAFGYSKLAFLRYVLIANTLVIAVVIWLVALFLSQKIAKPITELAEQLEKLDINSERIAPCISNSTTYELNYLTGKFNQLIQRTNEAFAFQKYTIQHISHQLKTPVSVLVSELENIEEKLQDKELKGNLKAQIVKAKSLGSIINVLLDISKIDAGQKIKKHIIRIDELIFDIIEELNITFPDFYFEVHYKPKQFNESGLKINANEDLLKQAFMNVLNNCIAYSNNQKALLLFDCSIPNKTKIIVSNTGPTLAPDEIKFLFSHFFRGANSKSKAGFGLGLALSKRIFDMHQASIRYSATENQLNVFEITFTLS
jgi:signal transduction histidine kinase